MKPIYTTNFILPGVWRITDIIESNRYNADMYLVEGSKKALLIDAGESKDNLAGFIREITNKPVELVVTHGHGDHAAAIDQFQQVYLSHKDVDILNHLFRFQVVPSSVTDLDRVDVFDLGNVKLEVIPLPGHTYGSVVLLDRERQLLFSSDALGSSILWLQLPHSEPLETYAVWIKKLEDTVKDMEELRIFVGHDSLKTEELTKQYITDIRILAEKIITGEIIGTPVMEQYKMFSGLSASYGQVRELVYKKENIHSAGINHKN